MEMEREREGAESFKEKRSEITALKERKKGERKGLRVKRQVVKRRAK